MVVVCKDIKERKRIMAQLLVKLGFARIPSDAAKLIQNDIYSVDLPTAYFAFVLDYSMRGTPTTNAKLFEMAARGIAIVVGANTLPREMEFCCEAFYPEHFR